MVTQHTQGVLSRTVARLLLVVLPCLSPLSWAFATLRHRPAFLRTAATTITANPMVLHARRSSPSKVVDPDGPTPSLDAEEIEEIDPESIPELRDITSADDLPRPIPHQPWRRGETAGCEAPIAAEWRQKAEEIITKSAMLVGGKVLDVTWYLTAVVVTNFPAAAVVGEVCGDRSARTSLRLAAVYVAP